MIRRAGLAAAAILLAAPEALSQRRTFLANENIPSVRKNGVFTRDFVSPDEQCGTKRGFNVAIEALPANGSVELVKTAREVTSDDVRGLTFLVFPADAAATLRRCIGRSVPMIRMTYRPRAEFGGFDQFGYRVTWTDGNQRSATIYLRVH